MRRTETLEKIPKHYNEKCVADFEVLCIVLTNNVRTWCFYTNFFFLSSSFYPEIYLGKRKHK